MDGKILKPVFSRQVIAAAVSRMADEIARDYQGRDLLLVVVLKGAFIFAADLVRALDMPLQVDFVKIESYCGTESSGSAVITRDMSVPVAGRELLVVEDIIDSGITLQLLISHLAGKGPKSIRVCTLVDKKEQRKVPLNADYTGLFCEDGFLVGYGLDLDEGYRGLDAIYEINDRPSCGGMNDNPM